MRNKVSEENIRFLIDLKVMKFKRNGQEDISVEKVERTLYGKTWQKKMSGHLNVLCQDIFNLTAEEIVDYTQSNLSQE